MKKFKTRKTDLISNFNVKTRCRLCLQEASDLYLIFDKIYAKDGATVAQILTECTRYKVDRNDKLPHQVCGVCMEKTHQAYTFKLQTERAYRKLLGILGKDIGPNKADTGNKNDNEKSTQTEKSALYPCVICGEKFFDIFDLHKHRQKQHRNIPKDCHICGKTYMHIRQLKSHLALEHRGEGFTSDTQCPICQRQFTRNYHVSRHLRNVHKQGSTQAPNSKTNKKKLTSTVEDERLASNNNSTVNCDGNGNRKTNKKKLTSTLEDERLASNNNSTVNCDGNGNSKTNEKKLTIAVEDEILASNNNNGDGSEIDDGVNSAGVEEVTHVITSDDDGDEHINVDNFRTTFYHLGIEKELDIKAEQSDDFECETNESSSDVGGLNDADAVDDIIVINENDIEDIEIQEATDFQGNVENSSPMRKSKRVKIVREYLNEKKSASMQPYRKNAIIIEEGKTNRCEQCQQSFTRPTHLRRHMLTHSSERLHKCTYCSKSFMRNDSLKRHIINLHKP